jgi:hypothetical protein
MTFAGAVRHLIISTELQFIIDAEHHRVLSHK